jgi:hypothetical protein
MDTWTRYEEITLTDDEKQHIENHGLDGLLERDSKTISLLAQTDTDCTYGYTSRTGDLLVAEAGAINWMKQGDRFEAILARYNGEHISDSYAQGIVVRLPVDAQKRRNLIAALKRLTRR